MLPFSLKVVWFVLSASGCVACWVVLWAFRRVAGVLWGPLAYGVGNTLLQGAFCLGMVYRMDPFRMPRAFCAAQTILISSGAFFVAGVALAFSMATSGTALRPKTWGDGELALKWRRIYALPVLGFPLAASAAHAALVLALDSAQPSDDMHCDSTAPEWVRLLGYAGVPLLLVGPSLYLSATSIYSVHRTAQHLQRADPEAFAAAAKARRSRSQSRVRSGGETRIGAITIAVPAVAAGGAPAPAGLYTHDAGADSALSLSFPTFANPDAGAAPGRGAQEKGAEDGGLAGGVDGDLDADGDADTDATSFRSEGKRGLGGETDTEDEGGGADADADGAEGYVLSLKKSGSAGAGAGAGMGWAKHAGRARLRPIPRLAPAVWRIVVFQVAFITVQILACITTVVDLAKRRAVPRAFGSQHVALVLAAWGPVVVFGHLPAVRRNLVPWRAVA